MKYKKQISISLIILFTLFSFALGAKKSSIKTAPVTNTSSPQSAKNPWLVSSGQDTQGDCMITISNKDSQNSDFDNQMKLPSIIIALKSPYGAKDEVCSDITPIKCQKTKTLQIKPTGRITDVDVIKATATIDNEDKFGYYSFVTKLNDYIIDSKNYSDKMPIGVYAIYQDEQQEKEIVDFLNIPLNVVNIYTQQCAGR